jgi:starch phosphorylase
MATFADKVRIQINDTHPALVIVELIRILTRFHDFSWEEAVEVARTCCSYTNHTVLKESLEEWNQNRIEYLLPRQYRILERLNLDLCNEVRRKFPNDEAKVRHMSILEGGQVRMAHLAIFGSHKVNGVSRLHSDILRKETFRELAEMFPDRFTNVTNGVTQRRFLLHSNPPLAALLTEKLGPNWITDFSEIQGLAKFADDPETQKKFLEVKKKAKRNLISFLMERNPVRDAHGKITGHSVPLDEEALFDVHIKRIHEYKRQFMNALHLIMLYNELKANPESRKIKRMAIFAGKAAPGYETAKQILKLLFCIARKFSRDPTLSRKLKVVFIENYNVSKAELIIPAADLSEQISTAGTEASGTGNMKLAMNGALTIATEDGANIEMREAIGPSWWPFGFGRTSEENKTLREQYNPWDIYMHHLPIRQAVDALRDHSLAESESEHQALTSLYHTLLEPHNSDPLDRYYVLGDLLSYAEAQKRVEDLFIQSLEWARFALHNIAGMGQFSSDMAVHTYAKNIWGITPCPIDPKELGRVRSEYSEHDKCRIFNPS